MSNLLMLLANSGGGAAAPANYFAAAKAALLSTLDTAGLLSRIDAFYDLGQPTEAECLVNLANPGTYDLTKVGTVTFTPNVGANSDGTTGYLDCGFSPSTATNYARDSASLVMFIDTPTASSRYVIGLDNADEDRLGCINPTGSGIVARINAANTFNDADATTEEMTFAFIVASRTTSGRVDLYLNGNETPIAFEADNTSSVQRTENFNLFRSITQITDSGQILRIAIIMDGLSASEQATLYSAINTYVEATEPRYFFLATGGQSNTDRIFRTSAGIGSGDGTAGSSAADRVLIPDLQAYLDAHYNDGRKNSLTVLNVAVGGSSVLDDDLNANIHWVETGPTDGALLTDAKTTINNAFDTPGRKAKHAACMIWTQGGADVIYVENNQFGGVATWETHTKYVFSELRSVLPGTNEVGILGFRRKTGEETGIRLIRQAQEDIANDVANTETFVDTFDIKRWSSADAHAVSDIAEGNDPPVGYDRYAQYIARYAANKFGCTDVYYRGPIVTGFTKTSDTTITATIAYPAGCAGTDFAPSTGIVGFRIVDDGGERTITSAVRTNATTVTLTTSTTIGANPTAAYDPVDASLDRLQMVKDNTPMGMPLRWTPFLTVAV